MNRTGKFVFKFFLFFISLTLLDGGRIFILREAENHFNATAEDSRDIEFPDQPGYSLLTDSDKWISEKTENCVSSVILSNRINPSINIKSQDYFCTIWQPPRV